MRGNSRDSIIFLGCNTKAASALTVRKFPDELRAALQQYAADKKYTQEEAVVALIRDALEPDHYWQSFAVDISQQA